MSEHTTSSNAIEPTDPCELGQHEINSNGDVCRSCGKLVKELAEAGYVRIRIRNEDGTSFRSWGRELFVREISIAGEPIAVYVFRRLKADGSDWIGNGEQIEIVQAELVERVTVAVMDLKYGQLIELRADGKKTIKHELDPYELERRLEAAEISPMNEHSSGLVEAISDAEARKAAGEVLVRLEELTRAQAPTDRKRYTYRGARDSHDAQISQIWTVAYNAKAAGIGTPAILEIQHRSATLDNPTAKTYKEQREAHYRQLSDLRRLVAEAMGSDRPTCREGYVIGKRYDGENRPHYIPGDDCPIGCSGCHD